MKFKHFKLWVSVLLVIAFCAPPCYAKATGYFYVVAYSYKDKIAYCSPVFTAKVRDKSYSEEEYVTDVAMLQKIEATFKEQIARTIYGDLSRYTFSARGAYKSFDIATKKLDAEITHYINLKMKVEKAATFQLKK